MKLQLPGATKPIKYHQLQYKDYTIMTDHPQEQYDYKEAAEKIKGRVLIGGLGLGYISRMLDKKPGITEIVVIEKTKTVIDLVWPHLNLRKARIIQEDLYKYLARIRNKQPLDTSLLLFTSLWVANSTGKHCHNINKSKALHFLIKIPFFARFLHFTALWVANGPGFTALWVAFYCTLGCKFDFS